MGDRVRVCVMDVRQDLELSDEAFKQTISDSPEGWDNVAAFPSVFVLAQLSKAVYEDSPKLFDDWKLLTTARNKDGYFGAALWNPQDRHVVVAHRGTNSLRAVLADVVGIGWNQVASQVHSACSFAARVMEVARAKKVRVSFTGHSLGGWLAQLTTFSTEYLIVDEKGFSTYTSTSGKCHTVVFDSPGAWEMIKKLSEGYYPRNHDQHNAHSKVNALDITTYMLEPNMVNTCGPHVGTLLLHVARPLDQDPGPKPTTPGWGLVQLCQDFWSFLRRMIARPVPEVKELFLKLGDAALDCNITSHSIDRFVKALNAPSSLEEAPHVYEIIDWPVYYFSESKTYKNVLIQLGDNFLLLVNMLSNKSYSDEYRDYRKQPTDANRGFLVELYREGDDNCKRGIGIHCTLVDVEKGVSRTNVFSKDELSFLTDLTLCRHDKEGCGVTKADRPNLDFLKKFLDRNRVPHEEILDMKFRFEKDNKKICGEKAELDKLISWTTQLFVRFPISRDIMREQTRLYPAIHDALYRNTSIQYEVPYYPQEGQTVSFESDYLGLGTFLESTEERVLHLTSSQATGEERKKKRKMKNPARLCYNVLLGANNHNTTPYKLEKHCTFMSWTDLQQIDKTVDVAAKLKNDKSTIDHLLVVDCSKENELNDSGVELFKKLILQLNDVEEGKTLKKIIVITTDEHSQKIRELFQDDDKRRKKEAMRPPEWSDLTEVSQKELLEMKVVTFQGRDTPTSLSALVTGTGDESHPSWDSIIDPETTFQLIQGDKFIRIGEKPLSMSDLEAAYSRPNETISMEHLLKHLQNALEPSYEHLFMMSGIENIGDYKKKLIEKLIKEKKLFDGCSSIQFEKLCRDNPRRIIHWVKVEAQNQGAQWLRLYDGTFYFKRKIDKVVLQKEKIKELLLKKQTNTFIFSGVDSEDDLKNILRITGESEAEFSSNVNNGTIKFGILNEYVDASDKTHWLNVEGPNNEPQIVWTRSKGSLDILRATIDQTKSSVSRINEDDFPKITERVVIVSDEPGMGKTATLTSLSDQLPESSWVVRVDLGNCQKAISKLPPSCSFNDAVRFVDDIYNPSSSSPLTRSLLKYALKKKKRVFLLFDAFDEIKGDDTSIKKVIYVLRCLQKKSEATIWITTRKHQTKTLENSLSVFTFSFESVETDQQQDFLSKFWQVRRSLKSSLDTPSIREENKTIDGFATTLLDQAKNMLGFEISSFIGVPLQLRMLAEAFQPELESSIASTDLSNLKLQNIKDFYQTFITAKYNIYFKEKIKLSCDTKYIKITLIKQFTKKHKILAFSHLCPKELKSFSKGKSLDSEKFNDDKTELLLIGLVQSHHSQTDLQFIHLSFSEYFTAESLMYWIHKSREGEAHKRKRKSLVDFLLKQIFLESKFKVVRIFLNNMLENNEVSFSRADGKYPRDDQERTALHIVVIENQVNIAECLLRDNVAMIDKTDKDSKTALHYAASGGDTAMVLLLLKHRATLEARCNRGRTPLHVAAEKGHGDVVKVLLKKGAEVNTQDEDGDTPLHVAASWRDPASVLNFLKLRATVDACGNKGRLRSLVTVWQSCMDFLKVVLEKRAKVNTQDGVGNTPLHDAVSQGHTASVLNLLEHGATLDARSNKGRTPLHEAAYRGREDVVKVLLEKGADVNTQDEYGWTPLHDAVSRGHTASVLTLLEHGATLDARGNKGRTPLNVAAFMSHEDVVKVLLKKGADVNTQDEDGCTPLQLATNIKHKRIVQILQQHGANT